MRHTAVLSDQFPVTAYIASIILNNPSATADVQEKFLATYREVLNHYRIIKSLAFHFHIRVFTGNLIFLFQENDNVSTTFLYICDDEIIQCPFRKKETITVGFYN